MRVSLKGWRKWSVVMAGLVMSFVLALRDELPGEFVTVVTVLVPAYVTANAAVHWKKGNEEGDGGSGGE